MKIVDGWPQPGDDWPQQPVLTIGFFDGVHSGHRQVLQAVTHQAREWNGTAGVLTFKNHPRKILTGRGPALLTTATERVRRFQQAGMEFTCFMPFNRSLSQLEPDAFVREILVNRLRVAGVVMGYDSCFGRDKTGTPELMESLGRQHGFPVCTVSRVDQDGCSLAVSSTRIRSLVEAGDLGEAARLLGRPVGLMALVKKGNAAGRQLGVPTANLDLANELRPQTGVYATWSWVGPNADNPEDPWAPWLGAFSGPYASVTNVGRRPTVNPVSSDQPAEVETHILDQDLELYGKIMYVTFVERIRDEQQFDGISALVEQIKKDQATAKEILVTMESPEQP